jgi:EAL domain-containing protein (putative c-di-GMP-specific phosphodiesterase class I)
LAALEILPRSEAMVTGTSAAATWPESSPSNGTLFIALPAGPAASTLRDYLNRSTIPFIEPYPAMVAVPLAAGRLQQMSQDLSTLMSASELEDSRTLLVGPGVVPTICELRHTHSLSTLIGRVQGEWLVDLLREGRLVTHYQPIMPCRAPESVFAYESLLRGVDHDGTLIPPNVIFGVAKSAALLSHLDRAARCAAIRGAVEHKLESKLFINFIPATIYDPAFSLSTTVVEIERSQLEPGRIVFEVVESEQVPDVDRLLHILDYYRDAGFLVALDDLGAGYSSLTLLTRLKPDFVKLDVGLVREVDRDDYKANIASKLLELAQSLGIRTIAEGVENRAEWQWLNEHNCDYVQGFFFGRPASPPEMLLPFPRGLASGTERSLRPVDSGTELSLRPVEAAGARRVQAQLAAELAARDEEIRRLREKVGELVMELDGMKRLFLGRGG